MIEQDDPDEFDCIQFSDPLSGQMTDMHLTFQHMANSYSQGSAAMLIRPRLSINDVEDMATRPEFVQLFQYKEAAACLGFRRRYDLAQKAVKFARGITFRQIRDRQVPPARVR